MLNNLDSDQDQRFVGPDLGPNCFAKVIRRKSPLARKELNSAKSAFHHISIPLGNILLLNEPVHEILVSIG